MNAARLKINPIDLLILAIFLAFSLLYFLGRLQSNFPNPILSGDAGNLVSFAAAQDHPELFHGDPALGEANLTGYYATIHMPLIKTLSRLTGGDYSIAFLLTLAPTILIQLVGFYILGRALFHHRFYAFLLAFLTAMPFAWNGLGEFWGIWPDPLPRVTYQALLPYLLTLVVLWRSQPRRWPWLMILSGALVFVHSISTPAMGFAIWLGLWMYLPAAWKTLKKLGVMLGLGLLFLLAMSPFVLNFLSFNARGASPNYDLVMSIIQTYQPPYLLNAPAALSLFATKAVFDLLLPVAVLGFYSLWRFGKAERALVVMVLTWFSAVLLISVGLPSVERVIENALHRLPIDTELARGMRYLVPLLLIFWLWPLAELSRRWSGRWAVRGMAILGLVLVGGWTASHSPESDHLLQAAGCLPQGQLVCSQDVEFSQLITALKGTPPGSKIWYFNHSWRGVSLTLAVRYLALRPLVYTQIDSGLYVYTNQPYLEPWTVTTRRVVAIQAMENPSERLQALLPLAREFNADYLVIDFPISPASLTAFPLDTVLQNKSFALFRLRSP